MTTPQQPVKVTVGQPVMTVGAVYRHETPGTVIKVGRVWIDVRLDDRSHGDVRRYRLDTQTDGSKYSNPARFYTMEQWAERERQAEVATFLREQGIDLRFESPWRGREDELADLIRTHLEPPMPDGPLGGAIDGPTPDGA